jgi:hypothetical protein
MFGILFLTMINASYEDTGVLSGQPMLSARMLAPWADPFQLTREYANLIFKLAAVSTFWPV